MVFVLLGMFVVIAIVLNVRRGSLLWWRKGKRNTQGSMIGPPRVSTRGKSLSPGGWIRIATASQVPPFASPSSSVRPCASPTPFDLASVRRSASQRRSTPAPARR